MSSIEDMVGAALERDGHPELVRMWKEICRTYNEGGPTLLESKYTEEIEGIRSKFARELKQIQSEQPIVKSRKAKRKRRKQP